jgi:two-component sensor histidine kinase
MILAAIFSTIALVCYLVLTIVVFWSNVQKKISVAFLLYMMSMFFWQLTALLVSLTRDAQQALFLYRLMTAGLGGYPIFYAIFTRVFMKKRFPRPLIVVGWIVYATLILVSVTGLVIESVDRASTNEIFVPEFGPLVPVIGVVHYAFIVYALITLLSGLRNEPNDLQRTRIKYLIAGLVITSVGSLTNLIAVAKAIPLDVAANTLNAILIAYAIVKYRLLDLRTVIRIGLRYSVPTIVIGTAYFLTIYFAETVFHLISGENIFLLSVLVAIIAAIVFQPFRDRIQVFIDKTFFREKYDSGIMLQRVSENAARYLNNIEDLARMIVSDVTKTLHIESMGFFLKKAETGEFVLVMHEGASFPPGMFMRADHPLIRWFDENRRTLEMREIEMIPTFKSLWEEERRALYDIHTELMVPIFAKQELAGFFILGNMKSDKRYSVEDVLMLNTLANQTAVTIENARLYWEKEMTLTELREAHIELERRVAERTRDLEVSNEKLTAALSEKEILMREIHHRVKNNLQIISSLLKLQMRSGQKTNVADILNTTENRVRSIALVHEHLYASQNLTNIDFSSYIRSIVRHLAETYGAELRGIKIEVKSEQIELDIGRAIPCGIIINELMTNALKYAFPDKKKGTVWIAFRSKDSGDYLLEIGDNGIGLPEQIDPEQTSSLGFKIVQTLALQLRTSLAVERANGTTITLLIPAT